MILAPSERRVLGDGRLSAEGQGLLEDKSRLGWLKGKDKQKIVWVVLCNQILLYGQHKLKSCVKSHRPYSPFFYAALHYPALGQGRYTNKQGLSQVSTQEKSDRGVEGRNPREEPEGQAIQLRVRRQSTGHPEGTSANKQGLSDALFPARIGTWNDRPLP